MEMAILFPLLILLILGVFELGGAFKDYLTVSNATKDGTRILSARGNDMMADCWALEAAVDSIDNGARIGDIVNIQIYKADTNGDQDPTNTNTYTYVAGDPTDCTNWSVSPNPAAYPPSDRNVLVGSQPLDTVGMRIVYDHNWYSGVPPFFNGDITIDEQTITRLEPDGFA